MSFASSGGPTTQPCWRDVRIVTVATAVSYTGTYLGTTALVLTLQSSGASGWAVAGLLLASLVPPVVLAPVAGWLVDRVTSRVLLVAVGVGQAATGVALAFATHPAAVVALVALLAAGLAVTSPTLQALLPDMVGHEHLGRASAATQSGAMLGLLGGPALAGLLVGQYGTRVPLLVNAGAYLAIVVAGLTLRTVRHATSAHSASAGNPGNPDAPDGGRVGGASVVRRDPLLLTSTALLACGIGVLTTDNVSAVYLIRGTLDASTTTYGLLESTWSVAMLLGAWLLGRARVSDRGLLVVAVGHVLVGSLFQLTVAAAPTVWWLFPAYVVGGLGNGLSNTARGVLVGRRAPAAVRGRVLAFVSAVLNSAVMVGYLFGGALIATMSPRAAYATAGCLGLAISVVLAIPTVRAFRAAATHADSGDDSDDEPGGEAGRSAEPAAAGSSADRDLTAEADVSQPTPVVRVP